MNELVGFTVEQTSRLTKLSPRQLMYWDKTGFFSPSVLDAEKRFFSRFYSFRQVVGLRTIALLRNTHGIPLQELRKVGRWLGERYESPWASLRLYVAGKRVFFIEPASDAVLTAREPSQQVFPIELLKVATDTEKAVEDMKSRQPDEVGQVSRKRNIANNQPVVAGTRIHTAAIWNLHKSGLSQAGILKEYPLLTKDDVQAAIAFERQQRSRKAG
jgi:uncharacterized protein (DUF433 family)